MPIDLANSRTTSLVTPGRTCPVIGWVQTAPPMTAMTLACDVSVNMPSRTKIASSASCSAASCFAMTLGSSCVVFTLHRFHRTSSMQMTEPPLARNPSGGWNAAAMMNTVGATAGLGYWCIRGVAPRMHQYPKPAVAPTVFIMAAAFQPPEELRAKGGSVICIDDVRWNRCNVKTTQLLPNVMAKQEAAEHDALDAIFVRDGMLTETSHANVMAVIGGAVWTHPITGHVLPGVTRDVVLELAKSMGIAVQEKPIPKADLPKATEVFLTGTLSDVMPIVSVDGKKVGDGRPGPIARKLFTALRGRLDAIGSAPSRA